MIICGASLMAATSGFFFIVSVVLGVILTGCSHHGGVTTVSIGSHL